MSYILWFYTVLEDLYCYTKISLILEFESLQVAKGTARVSNRNFTEIITVTIIINSRQNCLIRYKESVPV